MIKNIDCIDALSTIKIRHTLKIAEFKKKKSLISGDKCENLRFSIPE